MAATPINSLTPDQLNEKLNTTLTNGGTVAQNGLSTIVAVHKARLSQQQRYAASLEAEYGAQDSGVKAAQAKVAATNLVIAKSAAAQQQSSTPTLTLSADEWALQGRVYDSNSAPIPRLTVFLIDEEKLWLRQFGFSYTDPTGYFVLKGTGSTDAKLPALYIEIADDKGLPIYLDSAIFAPVIGQPSYKKITLTSQTPIGDPPQPIREAGIPSQG